MKTLPILLALFIFLSPEARTQKVTDGFVRVYNGTYAEIAEGNLVRGKREGRWNVYARKNINTRVPEIVEGLADEKDFLKNFLIQTPVQRINYENGLLHGQFEEYYPSGTIKKTAFFFKGQLDGDYREFGEKGNVLLSGRFFNGKRHRDWVGFYPDGKKALDEKYYMGLPVWDFYYYHPNGKVAAKIPHRQGRLQGEYEEYYADGRLKERGKFDKGKRQGEFELFGENGKLLVKGNFKEDLEDGKWEFFDQQGKAYAGGMYSIGQKTGQWLESTAIHPEILRAGRYEGNQKSGTWHLLSSEGQLLQEEYYENGKLLSVSDFIGPNKERLSGGSLVNGSGNRVYYSPNGNKIAWGGVENGVEHGIWQYFHANTDKVSEVGRMVDGLREGTWKTYSLRGELLREEIFNQGELVDPYLVDDQVFNRNLPKSNQDNLKQRNFANSQQNRWMMSTYLDPYHVVW